MINKEMGGKLPLSRLVEDAVWSAENGFAVTKTQQELTETKFPELKDSPGFIDTFLLNGELPKEGQLMKMPRLAKTDGRRAINRLDQPHARVAQLNRALPSEGKGYIGERQGNAAFKRIPLSSSASGTLGPRFSAP